MQIEPAEYVHPLFAQPALGLFSLFATVSFIAFISGSWEAIWGLSVNYEGRVDTQDYSEYENPPSSHFQVHPTSSRTGRHRESPIILQKASFISEAKSTKAHSIIENGTSQSESRVKRGLALRDEMEVCLTEESDTDCREGMDHSSSRSNLSVTISHVVGSPWQVNVREKFSRAWSNGRGCTISPTLGIKASSSPVASVPGGAEGTSICRACRFSRLL